MRHTLIPIEALEGLTADELEELIVFLRHTLQNALDLTPAERAAIEVMLACTLKRTIRHRQTMVWL